MARRSSGGINFGDATLRQFNVAATSGLCLVRLIHPQALVKNRPTLSPINPSGVLMDNRPPSPTRMLKRDSICPPFNRAVSIVSCSLTLRLTPRRAVIRDMICRLDSLCVLS